MSKDPVEQQMRRFLATGVPEAICVTGPWGVGKTFLWQNVVIPGAQIAKDIKLESYSYVSLFGINSLEQLKQAIFENKVSVEQIGKPFSVSNVEQNARRLSQPLIDLAKNIPIAGAISGHIGSMLTLTISKQIVCFDDLERKGDSLSIRDVMGLITFLKEQRECQVIVLTNNGDLTGEDQAQYEQYLEKVFDRTVSFDPTPERSARIALKDDPHQLTRRLKILGIANIRIIFKVQHMLSEILAHLESYDREVQQKAVHALVLACWVRYGKGTPAAKFLNERHSFRLIERAEKGEQQDPAHARWNQVLDKYLYAEIDAFDAVVFDAVNRGYVDSVSLREQADQIQRGVDSRAGFDDRRIAWELFHGSLHDNQDEVIAAFVHAFGTNVQTLRAGYLSQALDVLRELEQDEEADKLIELYCSTHEGNLHAFDVAEQQEYHSKIEDSKLLEAMDARYKVLTGQVKPMDALLDSRSVLGRRNDYERASTISVAELKTLFETLEGDELKALFSRCLDIPAPDSLRNDAKELRRKGKEALALVADSPVNALRLRRWGYYFHEDDKTAET